MISALKGRKLWHMLQHDESWKHDAKWNKPDTKRWGNQNKKIHRDRK